MWDKEQQPGEGLTALAQKLAGSLSCAEEANANNVSARVLAARDLLSRLALGNAEDGLSRPRSEAVDDASNGPRDGPEEAVDRRLSQLPAVCLPLALPPQSPGDVPKAVREIELGEREEGVHRPPDDLRDLSLRPATPQVMA